MGYLLVGFIFIFFNLNFPLGIISIGLLPEFAGWILIGKGVKELEVSEELFDMDRLKLCINAAVAISAVTYVINLTGMVTALDNIWNLGIWVNFLNITWIIFTTFVIFTIIRLVLKEASINMGINLLTQELEITYVIILIFKLILCGVGFVPELSSGVIVIMAAFGIFVTELVFLFLLYKARKNYIDPA